ncbi:WD40 repeat-like protein, partial [Rhizopogon vinicolor AM-OR11-026]
GHADWVRSVRWTQDGGQVLSGSDDGAARVWDEYMKIFDAKTGKLVANLKGHEGTVICLAWTADGTTLISGSNNHSIRMWNTTTWQQINVLTGHTNTVYDITISPNGRILASASFDGTARLWDLENGQPISSPLQHAGNVIVWCASFSTDGRLLATGCYDKNAYIWDIPIILREAGHTKVIQGVIHLPGGQRIMTCSDDGSLQIWNLKSGERIGSDWRDGASEVYVVALSPDGKQVVSGSADDAVRLWDIDTGKVVTKWTGHAGHVRSVRWTQDGGRVLSASFGGTAMVWDVERGETILVIKTWLNLESAIYSPDETMIATGGFNSEKEYIKIFDEKTGKLVTNLKGHTWTVYCLAWTVDGTTLISGSFDESIRTWNTTTWQQINVLTAHTNCVYGIAISPNGRILASASWDRTARLWNLENGKPISSPLQHSNWVRCASFSTDGKLLTTGCDDNNAYTWDIPTILREAGLDDLLLNPNVSLPFLISLPTEDAHPRTVTSPYSRYAIGLYIYLVDSKLMYPRQMLHNDRVSGAGATILIPIDYPQVFSTTQLIILPYVICISSYFFLTSVFSAL